MKTIITISLFLISSMIGLCQDDLNREASFPGGNEKLLQYLRHSINWDNLGETNEKIPTVTIHFIINELGQVKNPSVIKGFRQDFDIEALRIISDMPGWNPKIQDGKATKTRMILLVEFNRAYGH